MDAAPAPLARPAIIEAACPAEARSLPGRVRCGYVRVRLDRTKPNGKRIRIYFEHYGRRDRSRPRRSTIVSLEGGPGFPVTDDRADRAKLWRPVSKRRALVLVDLRGTGGSTPLGCKAFSKTTLDYWRRAGRCARQIGRKRDFYSTSQAVQDLDRVLDAVRAGQRIDLYGDSYGTYAAQAYALRYGDRLRSLTLDGAYPLPGTDPAWVDLLAAGRRGLRLTCARRPNCPSERAGTTTVSLLAKLARRVRERPIVGYAPDWDGTPMRVRLNEKALVWVASATYYYPGVHRDLPAALLAERRGDTKPILRLAAETLTLDAGGEDPPHSSEALYLSVICHDYPQLWDPGTPRRRPLGRGTEPDRRLPATGLPAFQRTRLDAHGVRGRLRVSALALAGQARSAGSARCGLPDCSDARPERRPRLHHDLGAGPGGREPLPELDVRRACELVPRDRDPRFRQVRVAALRPLPPTSEPWRHELRRRDRRRASRPSIRALARRGEARAGGRRARRVASPRPPARLRRRADRSRRHDALVGQLRRHEPGSPRRHVVVPRQPQRRLQARPGSVRAPRSGQREGDLAPLQGRGRSRARGARPGRAFGPASDLVGRARRSSTDARLRGRIGGRTLRATMLAP